MYDPTPPPSSYSLPDPALAVILNEWTDQPLYDPPNTDLPQWISSIHAQCESYGIPDTQRPLCAIKFIQSPLRDELDKVLADARTAFGPIHWAQFQTFIIAFDRDFREKWDTFPFYKKYPKATGAALGIAGGVLLAPVAVVGVLSTIGFTSAGVAAGSIAATIQSIVYGGATGGLFSLLQSAGATMVLPSIGTIFAGAATTSAGIAVMSSDKSSPSPNIFLSNLNPTTAHPTNATTTNDNYLLTPKALQSIIKSWKITPYNPPLTISASSWLSRIHDRCQRYGIPASQHALCAMHHMRADCQSAAHAAACEDMSWDQFKAWLLQYNKGVS